MARRPEVGRASRNRCHCRRCGGQTRRSNVQGQASLMFEWLKVSSYGSGVVRGISGIGLDLDCRSWQLEVIVTAGGRYRRSLLGSSDKAPIMPIVARPRQGVALGAPRRRGRDRLHRGRRGRRGGDRRRPIALAPVSGVAAGISRLAERLSRRDGREKGRGPKLPSDVGGGVGAGDGSRHGLNVLLPGLVVEILDAPFYKRAGSQLPCLQLPPTNWNAVSWGVWGSREELPGTASRSRSFANFMRSVSLPAQAWRLQGRRGASRSRPRGCDWSAFWRTRRMSRTRLSHTPLPRRQQVKIRPVRDLTASTWCPSWFCAGRGVIRGKPGSWAAKILLLRYVSALELEPNRK